jgi:hypothetical protein
MAPDPYAPAPLAAALGFLGFVATVEGVVFREGATRFVPLRRNERLTFVLPALALMFLVCGLFARAFR